MKKYFCYRCGARLRGFRILICGKCLKKARNEQKKGK